MQTIYTKYNLKVLNMVLLSKKNQPVNTVLLSNSV